jgi:hypothetical protein
LARRLEQLTEFVRIIINQQNNKTQNQSGVRLQVLILILMEIVCSTASVFCQHKGTAKSINKENGSAIASLWQLFQPPSKPEVQPISAPTQ